MKSRLFYIDAARCCACLLVVVSHVFAPICAGMNHYSRPMWWFFNLFDSVIRPSAAIYVMISGILFLGSSKDVSYIKFVWKRYAKLLPPFIVWSLIYVYYGHYGQDEPFQWGPAFRLILQGPTAYHLWFMYMILALYLAMPVLRRIVRSISSVYLAAFVIAWMGFLVLRFFAPNTIGDGSAATFFSYAGYAVLGYALSRTDYLQKSTTSWFLLWLGIVLFNAWQTYRLTVLDGGIINEKFYFGAAPLVAVQAAAMMVLLKKFDHDSLVFKMSWLSAIVKRFSRHSYNIYLNHALIISLLSNGYLGFVVSEKTGPNAAAGVALTSLLVLTISLSLSLLIVRVPILSRLLTLAPAPEHKDEVPVPS